MDSGRFLLAVVLMIALVVLTNVLFPPVPPPTAEPAAPAGDTVGPPAVEPFVSGPDTGRAVAPSPVQPAAPPVLAPSPQPVPAEPVIASEDTIRVTSPLYRIGIGTRGGRIASVELSGFESYAEGSEGRPVQLEPPGGSGLIRHRLQLGDRVVDLASFPFTAAQRTAEIEVREDGGPEVLQLTYADSGGARIDLEYTFHPDQYLVEIRGRVHGAGTTPQLLVDIGPTLAFNEAERAEDERSLAYVVNSPQVGIQSVLLSKLKQQRIENGPLSWVALKNKYFVVAAMQDDRTPMPFGGLIAKPNGQALSADLTATLLPNTDGVFAYRLYMGPQNFDRLAALGNQLQDVSVFGWRFLQPVLRPLGHAITWALIQMQRALGLGYGWVLILFGFLIRFVLWPLNAKAMRSQIKNMELQPKMKELQTRYKGDPQKLQQEMLRLYKEEGFNPMGGCLPMLLPLPVLITLFFVFQSTIEFRGVPFLWLPDLSTKDPLYILPVALGLSMFIQQWLNMRTTKDAPPQMKWMTYFMPIFLTFLFLNFASGLNLYYASMNLASVPQQLQIMKERQKHMQGKGGKS